MTVLDFNQAAPQVEADRLQRGSVDVDSVRERLSGNPRAFIDWLYAGRALCTRHEARIGDVIGTPGASLSIALTGSSAGLWHDHATGEGGDLISLYMACMGYEGGSNFMLAVKEIASEFLGDQIPVARSSWQRSATQRIDEKKQKLGDKPRADMLELGAPVATWKYYDTRGNVIASVVRYEPDGTPESKTYRPYCFRTVEGRTKWVMGAPELRPLYRLPEISLASTVVLVEGEKCAAALASVGIEATTAMQGAKAPIEKTDWSPLHGKTVVIWPDKDGPGEAYAQSVAARLSAIGCSVQIVLAPVDAPEKWDAADCVAEGRDVQSILAGAANFGGERHQGRLILTASEFVAGFRPPTYLVDSIIQKSYLYSLAAKTGAGKTAVTLHMASCVARGSVFGGKQTEQGGVLFLAGENPDDIRARYLVLAAQEGFDPGNLNIRFIDGVVDIDKELPRIRAEADDMDELSCVIVDTVAAYYSGVDANDNVQQGAYARILRRLTTLKGKPAVIANAHPVKNASRENLLPAGGGAFLNEVDGNLTLWSDAKEQTVLHWQGKFRGPEFEPIVFKLETASSDTVVNANGELMPSVVASHMSDVEADMNVRRAESDENTLLRVMDRSKGASIAELARRCGFTSRHSGEPQKSRAFRLIQRLKDDKLIEPHRRGHRLTAKGRKEIGADDDD